MDRPVPVAGHPGYLGLLDDLFVLHQEKSAGYGTQTDPFGNYNTVARMNGRPAYMYAVDRCQEKLARIYSLEAQGRTADLREEFLDVASGMLCAEALRAEATE